MADKIRIGIVGAGAWGTRAHIPALKSLPDYELKGICTSRPETATAAAKAHGIELAFHNVNDMANHPEIDLVAVCVKVPAHYELTMASLKAGKHTYCEWPLGANLKEAEELTSFARQQGVRTMVGLQSRAAPGMSYMRDLIRDGYVGDVLAVNMTLFTGGILERPLDRTWQADKRNGANTLTISAGHAIDGLNYVAGEFQEVSARIATQVPQWKATDTGAMVDVDSPDNVLISGLLENGAVCSIHVASVPFSGSGWRLEIYGREGTLFGQSNGMVQLSEASVLGSRGSAAPLELTIPDKYTLTPEGTPQGAPLNIGALYTKLADGIQHGAAIDPDFELALTRHKLLDAIERSSAEGRAIKL